MMCVCTTIIIYLVIILWSMYPCVGVKLLLDNNILQIVHAITRSTCTISLSRVHKIMTFTIPGTLTDYTITQCEFKGTMLYRYWQCNMVYTKTSFCYGYNNCSKIFKAAKLYYAYNQIL